MMKHNLHSRDYFPRILQAFQRIRNLSKTRLVIVRAGWWDLLTAGPAIIFPEGFKPTTPRFVAACSIPLSYGSNWGLRIRTSSLLSQSQPLSPIKLVPNN